MAAYTLTSNTLRSKVAEAAAASAESPVICLVYVTGRGFSFPSWHFTGERRPWDSWDLDKVVENQQWRFSVLSRTVWSSPSSSPPALHPTTHLVSLRFRPTRGALLRKRQLTADQRYIMTKMSFICWHMPAAADGAENGPTGCKMFFSKRFSY